MVAFGNTSETVLDRFARAAHDDPDRPLFVFVDENGNDRETLTVGGMLAAVHAQVDHLTTALGLRRGDRALMVYPPSLDFVIAFVACLAAGIVPVPVAPPNPFKLGNDLDTFEAIAVSSGSRAVLTNTSYRRKRRLAAARRPLSGHRGAWSQLPWYRTDTARTPANERAFDPSPPQEPAFLQYTSGSTSAPKGVMISHGNILHQLGANAADLRLDESSRSVIWLPHFHDFCLVSGILSALYGNGSLYLMSPLTFLRRPHLWFDVLSRIGATHTAAPDFAYRLAVRRTTPEQRQQWDLSSLRVMMSAGEPVRASTVDDFLSRFAAARLDPTAFGPAYGLAEHTVGVSTSGRHRFTVDRRMFEAEHRVVRAADATADTLTLFGCGSPSPGVDVRIVDPETHRELEPGRVGEIWVDSPSKALGYFGLPDLSAEVFGARIEGGNGTTTYLRTGDLGFIQDGEVHVAGRCKDMIIVRGRNLYPQDIEESAFSSHPWIRPGRAVAFPAPGPGGEGERIVVLAEVRRKKVAPKELDELVHAVRAQVVRDHKAACDEVLIARPGTILKTTSGKLRRQACRQAYLSGDLTPQVLRADSLHRTETRSGGRS